MSSTKLFCRVLPLNVDAYANQFGLTDNQIALSLYNNCRRVNSTVNFNYYGLKIGMKEFVFVETEKQFPFSGWTDVTNTSYIFVNESSTWGSLVSAMIHELAISFDAKNFLNPQQLIFLNPQTANAADEWSKLFLITQLPEITFTLATVRADRVKALAINELLYGNSNIIDTISEAEIQNILSFYSSNILPDISPYYFDEASRSSLFEETSLNFHKVNNNYELLKVLFENNSKIQLIKGLPETDFLNFMMIPEFSTKIFASAKAFGPGCSYCGGALSSQTLEIWNAKWKSIVFPSESGFNYDK